MNITEPQKLEKREITKIELKEEKQKVFKFLSIHKSQEKENNRSIVKYSSIKEDLVMSLTQLICSI